MTGRRVSYVLVVALSVFAFPCVAQLGSPATSPNAWITATDIEAARKADLAAKLYCAGGFKGKVDRDANRKVLDTSMGSRNTILAVLENSKSQDQLATELQKQLRPADLIPQAGSLVFAIILLIVWFFCCWTCCPCCRCCRVCQKRRKTPKFVKIVLVLLGLAFFAGTLIAAAVASSGYESAVAGFNNLACTAATLVNGTLSGRTDAPTFLGMMPLLEQFHQIEKSLDYTSTFMQGVRAQIDATQSIDDAVRTAAEVLKLLQDAFASIPADVANNHHKCEFCTVMQPVLAQTVSALQDGVGSAMSKAREEVKKQLGPSTSVELQKTFRNAAEPLSEVKKLVRDSLGIFTDTESFLLIRDQVDGPVPGVKIIIGLVILFAALLGFFSLFTLLWFLCRERIGRLEICDENGDPLPKLSKTTHRLACCTWCWSWLYCFAAFLIGGILLAISNPLSSLCIVMDDFTVPMLVNIGPALGVKFGGPESEQMLSIIDQCILNRDTSANPALMDILSITNATTGTKQTMRQKVVGQVKDQIQAQFSSVDAKLANNTVSIAASPEVAKLVALMTGNPIDMLLIVDTSYDWKTDANFQALFLEPTLAQAFPSSVRCTNDTVSADVPSVGGQTMPGVDNFVTELSAFGTRVATPGCADKVVCDVTRTPQEQAACAAGNNFVDLKRNIQALTTFRCDVFLDPADGVSDCDPFNMVGTQVGGVTRYTSSCQYPDGRMQRKSRSCDLDGFVAYIQEFGQRINKSMGRVDTTVTELGSGISRGLRGLVDKYVIGPIEVIVNGVTCGFLAKDYRSVVDGLCYQGVVGFYRIGQSYAACGVISLLTVFLMYGLWRRSIDNVNAIRQVQMQVAPCDVEPEGWEQVPGLREAAHATDAVQPIG